MLSARHGRGRAQRGKTKSDAFHSHVRAPCIRWYIKMNGDRLPDFFIVGAPKCGTTALYKYLFSHSRIFLPSLKEPHYFLEDIFVQGAVLSLRDYLDLFKNAPPYAMLGEASVWYFYSDVAIRRIMEVSPAAKIIVILRYPTEAAEALHAHKVFNLTEDIANFEEAWNAQTDRAAGQRIPLHCDEPFQLQYAAVYNYPPQLRRLMEVVPAEQIKVVIYEEFFSDPQRGFASVLDFLGLPREGAPPFEPVNARRNPGNLWIYRLLAAPPTPFRPALRLAASLSRRFGLRLGRLAALAVAAGGAGRPVLRSEFRTEIDSHFSDCVSQTEGLLGRAIPAWQAKSATITLEKELSGGRAMRSTAKARQTP